MNIKDTSCAIAQRDYSIHQPVIDTKQRASWKNWVAFGGDNLYTDLIYTLYSESALQRAIIDNQIKYTYGAGLREYSASIFTPNLTERWEDFLKKCITDMAIYGAFAVQIIMNEDGNRFSYYHTPVNQVRLGGYNEENIIEKAYLATDWRRISTKSVVEIKMWGSEQPSKGERYLMYCKPYNPNELFYAIPKWMSCANWIAASIALGEYYQNYIRNNFSANLSVTYPCDLDEEKKKEVYEMLTASFGGQSNAGNIVLLFGENGSAPVISSIESVDADLYNSVADLVTKQIVTGNRLTSPTLAGISTSDGFSSRADEIQAAYSLYKITVIDEIRGFIMDKMNYLLQLNGQPRCLVLDDYDLSKELNGMTAQNDEKEAEQIDADEDATNNEQEIDERHGNE